MGLVTVAQLSFIPLYLEFAQNSQLSKNSALFEIVNFCCSNDKICFNYMPANTRSKTSRALLLAPQALYPIKPSSAKSGPRNTISSSPTLKGYTTLPRKSARIQEQKLLDDAKKVCANPQGRIKFIAAPTNVGRSKCKTAPKGGKQAKAKGACMKKRKYTKKIVKGKRCCVVNQLASARELDETAAECQALVLYCPPSFETIGMLDKLYLTHPTELARDSVISTCTDVIIRPRQCKSRFF
jgi:hypothetical protein